jgi:sec-independent protein translocase protein TatA
MFGSMGITELVLILFIVLIIFGAGKLPQLGEGLGKAIKGFKKSVHEADAIEAEASAQQGQIQQPGAPAAPDAGTGPGNQHAGAPPPSPPPGGPPPVRSEPPKA